MCNLLGSSFSRVWSVDESPLLLVSQVVSSCKGRYVPKCGGREWLWLGEYLCLVNSSSSPRVNVLVTEHDLCAAFRRLMNSRSSNVLESRTLSENSFGS